MNKLTSIKTIKHEIQVANIKKRLFIDTVFLVLYLKVTNVPLYFLLLIVNVILILLSRKDYNLIHHCYNFSPFK